MKRKTRRDPTTMKRSRKKAKTSRMETNARRTATRSRSSQTAILNKHLMPLKPDIGVKLPTERN